MSDTFRNGIKNEQTPDLNSEAAQELKKELQNAAVLYSFDLDRKNSGKNSTPEKNTASKSFEKDSSDTAQQMNQDTVRLLRECSSGTKMAVSSIDEVTDHVTSAKLRRLLAESRQTHETLCGEIHRFLLQNNSSEKEPNPMAKSMSWLKTNMKLTMNESDSAVADLMTDGCNMGVKSLHKYLNQYAEANAASKSLCRRLAAEEERLGQNLRAFL